jgi:hypothetical protein
MTLHSKVVDCKVLKCKAVARAWSRYILLKTSLFNLFPNLKLWKKREGEAGSVRTFHNLLVTSSAPLSINTAPAALYWLSHDCVSVMRISRFLLKSTLQIPNLTSTILLKAIEERKG